MAARLEHDSKRRAEKKSPLFSESTLPHFDIDARSRESSALDATLQELSAKFEDIKRHVEELRRRQEESRSDFAAKSQEHYWEKGRWVALRDAREVALWDEAIESLGRSAGVLEELAESTGEAIARIAARGDRIDRIQKDTRAILNALVAPEADA